MKQAPYSGEFADYIHFMAYTGAMRAPGVDLNFHDLRHFFISTCVMAGIDYMTIARWVGLKDGGVLIGKVYGHLSDEHARKATEGLRF